jgi:hypothetical protein
VALRSPPSVRRACASLSVVVLLAAGCGRGGGGDPANLLPVADAGPDTVGRVNTQVTLDGSASGDSEGATLTFRWDQVEGPLAVLSSLTAERPAFTPTVPGTYVFDLIVEDDLGLPSAPVHVTVVVIDDGAATPRRAPAAVARAAGLRHAAFLSAAPGVMPSSVVLSDGSARSVVLVDVASDATDDPPAAAVTGLRVVDVVVGAAPFARLYAAASAGDEDPVTLPSSAGGDEIVSFAVAGESFVLDGSRSQDDGLVRTFTWTQVGGPFRFTTEDSLVEVVVPTAGTYVFDLVCTDDIGLSSFVQRLVVPVVPAIPGVGPPAARAAFVSGTIPDGDAETPEVASVGSAVVLTGASSFARNGGALTYAWEQVEGPIAILSGATTAGATVVPPVPGAYAFELRVTDANGVADTAVLHLTVAPVGSAAPTPVLQPISDVVLPPGGGAPPAVLLDAGASRGAGALTFLWQQTAGVPVFIENAASGLGSIVPPQAGTYVFELRVADDHGPSAPVRRSFRVH